MIPRRTVAGGLHFFWGAAIFYARAGCTFKLCRVSFGYTLELGLVLAMAKESSDGPERRAKDFADPVASFFALVDVSGGRSAVVENVRVGIAVAPGRTRAPKRGQSDGHCEG